MSSDRYSRRALLKALGVGAAMLPLLDAEPAFAAGGSAKRLMTITWGNGVFTPNWLPTNADLTVAGALPSSLAALQPYAKKMLVLQNVHLQSMLDAAMPFGGHFSMPCLFTGTSPPLNGFVSGGPSIDQTISDALGSKTPLLNLGAKSDTSSSSWAAANQKNQLNTDPTSVFGKLFAGASMTPAVISSTWEQDKSVLDLVYNQLTSFSNRVGAADKVKIQAHMDAVRALETQLQSMPMLSSSCTAPTVPAGVSGTSVGGASISKYPVLVDTMMKLAGTALVCGAASVITLDLMNDGGGNDLTFPTLGIASPDYHAITHSSDTLTKNPTATVAVQKSTIDAWWYKNVATLLGILDGFAEGDGTALDNSVIVSANDMSIGHSTKNIPYILYGGAGGFFKTGRMVDTKGVANNLLLTTICHAMGLSTITGVGAAKYAGNIDSLLTM
jgi:hypothetical protein